MVLYKVYWVIGPSLPFASTAIGIRSLLVRSKSPITALPNTGGSALMLLVLLSFFSRSPKERCLHWQLML